ncbi:hypothetical protein PAXRUDRAFT_833658 [Paxillus rubicundulus Ve08.2h10]|uniref:Uncharacterized protein n=1 Tax=Paxillus rubicundulus Ve08.2h10 TaxID=930991 RepID=A0A0D0CXD1_9AGAM|nr:hypothetical protein PAXRUDRAFT_833658 [Paxillus rubicundulus Ve08.2h10]
MSLSFGSLSLLSPWTPLYLWDDSVHSRIEFRSFICALVFVAIILILAYLTNPTEISFRAYLTERSFRQHLSHLDDLTDDSGSELDCGFPRSRVRGSDRMTTDCATLPFHFANRASISLRTPKHVFHSFGICTIATTRGAAATSGGPSTDNEHGHADLDGSVSSDSWFIGAFGHWWRGVLVESWYHDAIVRSKDAEGWSSGILGFKALDDLHDYNGLPFAKPAPCPRPSLRGSPPKLRNRERSAQRSGLMPRRNSTPPPLPKSASLPLHADHRLYEHIPSPSQPSLLSADHKRIAVHAPPVAHTISRTSSTSGLLDHSPIIAEVLRQITASQASVNDLQNQLEEAQNAAIQSRSLLDTELDELRTRKREEDQKRADGRTRTKALEETRRIAETSRREAEKKMKAARNTKQSAMRRGEEIELEIERLKQRMEHDRTVLAAGPDGIDTAEEQELICELEKKRKEVRVAEEVIAALNTRARELEEKITESKSRLRAAHERVQAAKIFLDLDEGSQGPAGDGGFVDGGNYGPVDTSTWSSSYNPFDLPADDVLASPVESGHVQGNTDSESGDVSRSPKPTRLSLGALSNFNLQAGDASDAVVPRAKGYALFDDNIESFIDYGSTSLSPHSSHSHNGYLQFGQTTTFSPFGDAQTPSSVLIPSSLISVIDSPSADWKGDFSGNGNGPLNSSPVSFTGHPLDIDPELDAFELRHRAHTQRQMTYDQMSVPYRTISDPSAHAPDDHQVNASSKGSESASWRWFSASAKEKQRKGLNPDAKVFRLPRRKLTVSDSSNTDVTANSSGSSYDALNPTGLMSTITSSTPSSLLRAFAPSRAEREVLQRALGGSTNTSLERLPSLSDVGSIPSSPVHAHVEAQRKNIGEKDCALPAWLQSLPLIRKPNFSPWEDEEPVATEAKRK